MECVTAVASGDGTALAHRQQDPVNMARWHTAQIRLLRVYMAEQRPSDELTTLAVYGANVYVPTVMSIRHRPDLVEAPKHFFNQLERQRHHLTGDALDAVQRILCRSSYMAHPKALLLAMLGDERKEVRQEAVHLVPGARRRKTSNQLRSYNTPVINLGAQTYVELADMRKYARDSGVEPPFISSFSTERLNELVDEPLRTSVPCRTQSTQRSVKMTAEAVVAVTGADRQDGYSLNKVAYRRRVRGE